MPKLRNRRRERFAVEVAAMTPLDRAYVAAGFKDSAWARYNASRLANTLEVAERIKELHMEFERISSIHAEYIRRKLLPLIEANAKDLFVTEDTGEGRKILRLKSISEIPRDLAAAIQRIKFDPDTGAPTEYVLHDKVSAGTVLLRSVGGLLERHEFSSKDGGPIPLGEADWTKLTDEELHQLERILTIAMGHESRLPGIELKDVSPQGAPAVADGSR
jgi:Terminase small subunit